MLRFTAAALVVFLAACSESPSIRLVAQGDASFAKATSNRTATFVMPAPSSALSIRGDGLFPDGSSSDYTSGVCGVTATIFAPNPRQDAVLQTDNPTANDKTCAPYGKSSWPRALTVDYGDGTETLPGTFNVHDLGTVVGTSLRFFGLALSGKNTRCVRLQFGGPFGGDSLWVTQTSSTSWHVYSQTAPHNTAACELSSGAVTIYANLNVDFTITTP
jgi:hypothetical protein